MISISNAHKTFNLGTASETPALNGVSLDVPAGQFIAVIGSNGAGKSTLLNAIAGDVTLDQGTVHIDGADVTRLPTYKRTRWISRVFQDPVAGTASDMTIEENLALAEWRGLKRTFSIGLNQQRRALYQERLAILGIGIEDRLSEKVGALSGGQRQSLALIMAIIREPQVLLLDEHAAALDPKTAKVVLDATVDVVSEARLTTIMVTHNMQHAIDYGDRLIMMEGGLIRYSFDGAEKRELDVQSLIDRFRVADDKLLLTE